MKRMLCLLLCLTMLLPMAFATVGATGETETPIAMDAQLYQLKDGARAALTMTFDDGLINTARWLNEKFALYGLKGSLMMVVQNNFKTNKTAAEQAAEIAKWRAVLDEGYLEPQSHSMTHTPMPAEWWASTYYNTKGDTLKNNTQQVYQRELVDAKARLKEFFPDFDILTFAAPNSTLSTYSFETDEQGNLLFDAGGARIPRQDGGAFRVAANNYYAVRMGANGNQSLDPIVGSVGTAGSWSNLWMRYFQSQNAGATLNGYVDDAIRNGEWVITLCHGITENSNDILPEEAEQFFAYIAPKVRDGVLWSATFSEVTKYIRERQNTTISAVRRGDGVDVTLTMAAMTADGLPLPTDVFDMPLTAKVEVPSTWQAVEYLLNGETCYAKTFSENGKQYVKINAVPNGGTVTLTPKNMHGAPLSPTYAATLKSDGTISTDALTVSAHSTAFTPGYSARVYTKLSFSGIFTNGSVYLPVKIGAPDEGEATVKIYGVSDPSAAAGWSASTLTMENAPAVDYYGAGVLEDAVFGGAPIATLTVSEPRTYMVDVAAYARAMQEAGGSVGTLIFVLESEEPLTLPISFDPIDDRSGYSYRQDFEGEDFGFLNGGVEEGDDSYHKTVEDENHTEGGKRALMLHLTKTYQRLFITNVVHGTNTASGTDVGTRYTVTFFTKATRSGTFTVRMGDGTGAGATAGEQDQEFTVTEGEVGKWVERVYRFEITESMLENQYFHMMIHPRGMKQTIRKTVDFYIDDISVYAHDRCILTPTAQQCVGGEDRTIALAHDPARPMLGVEKTYLTFDLPKTALEATLRLRTEGEGGTVTLYALREAADAQAPTYRDVPGNCRDEKILTEALFFGVPLGTYAVGEPIVLDLLPLTAIDTCALILTSEDGRAVRVCEPTLTVNVAEHVYKNACDATCDVCDHTRTPSDHVYAYPCSEHCESCGLKRTASPHTYDHPCTAACGVCGLEREPSPHEYNSIFDTGCRFCGLEREVSESLAAMRTHVGRFRDAVDAIAERTGESLFAALKNAASLYNGLTEEERVEATSHIAVLKAAMRTYNEDAQKINQALANATSAKTAALAWAKGGVLSMTALCPALTKDEKERSI